MILSHLQESVLKSVPGYAQLHAIRIQHHDNLLPPIKLVPRNCASAFFKLHLPGKIPGQLETDPIEAVKIRMEELNLKQVDLVDAIGGKNRVSEIMNRKRKLTVEMIRNLTGRLNLSPGLLIHDYKLTGQKRALTSRKVAGHAMTNKKA
jgi:plasmid maintenance system antidote protein VapI